MVIVKKMNEGKWTKLFYKVSARGKKIYQLYILSSHINNKNELSGFANEWLN